MMQGMSLPFEVAQDLQVNRTFVRTTPWVYPATEGFEGTRPATGESVIIVMGEMPLHFFTWLRPVTKEELEELHLQKFLTDFCIATGTRPYLELSRGSEPPDFVCQTPNGTRRVDCTQFIVGSRRAAHAMFRSIRSAIFDAGPDRFSHLCGLLLWVWADTKRARLDLPLRAPARQELLDALADFEFQPDAGVSSGSDLPQEAPNFHIHRSSSGWRFYGIPFMNALPTSPFFIKMGFEIAFNYPTEHSAPELWAELERVILQHDQSSVDDVVISVGAPDRDGYIYLGEDALFEFMVREMPMPALTLAYTKRVLVHRWESGEIVQLYPAVETIGGALYQASVSAHQPLTPH